MIFRLKRTKIKKNINNDLYFQVLEKILQLYVGKNFSIKEKAVTITKIVRKADLIQIEYKHIDSTSCSKTLHVSSIEEFKNIFGLTNDDKKLF